MTALSTRTNDRPIVLRLRAGPAWPANLSWPPGEHSIVVIGSISTVSSAASEVALTGIPIDGGEPAVLVHPCNGRLVPTFNVEASQRAMKSESYRPEHALPISARLPFHYHRLPGFLRNALAAAALARGKTRGFPAQLRDCGPLILSALFAQDTSENQGPLAVLTHDIDTARGFDWIEAVAAVDESVGAKACWNIVPRHYPINETTLSWLAGRGHEIGLHGIWHTNREAFLKPSEMACELDNLADFRNRFKIRSYRGPSWYRTAAMFDVLAGYFDTDLTTLDIDLVCPGGAGGVGTAQAFRIRPTLVEIPCTLPFEAPMVVGPRPQSLAEFWRPKVHLLKNARGMAVVNTHPDPNYLGNESMLVEYRSLLTLLVETGWTFKLPREITVS